MRCVPVPPPPKPSRRSLIETTLDEHFGTVSDMAEWIDGALIRWESQIVDRRLGCRIELTADEFSALANDPLYLDASVSPTGATLLRFVRRCFESGEGVEA